MFEDNVQYVQGSTLVVARLPGATRHLGRAIKMIYLVARWLVRQNLPARLARCLSLSWRVWINNSLISSLCLPATAIKLSQHTFCCLPSRVVGGGMLADWPCLVKFQGWRELDGMAVRALFPCLPVTYFPSTPRPHLTRWGWHLIQERLKADWSMGDTNLLIVWGVLVPLPACLSACLSVCLCKCTLHHQALIFII